MQTSSSIQRLHVEAMELVHSGSVFSDALVHFTTMHNRIAGDDTQARPPGQWPPHPRPMMTLRAISRAMRDTLLPVVVCRFGETRHGFLHVQIGRAHV